MRFCWHKWSRWSAPFKGYDGHWHQVCECEKCGAITRRTAIHLLRAQITGGVNEALKEISND